MRRTEMRRLRSILITAAVLLCLILSAIPAYAATDEILDFTVKVDVNEDASLNMTYHIDWKVLDDSIGELEWIDLGVPNSHHEEIKPLSKTVKRIEDNGNSLAIYLDKGYGEDETVSVDFSMKQDYMYQIDKFTEGETVYSFTPAWFDEMDVDQLTILWNAENATGWQPDCEQEDGYLAFHTALGPGERYTMSVTYPNDTFGFSPDRQMSEEEEYDYDYTESDDGPLDWFYLLVGMIAALVVVVTPIIYIFNLLRWLANGLGFGSRAKTKKKIKRTKIEYFPSCPGCGAVREEGKDKCPYCGRSMIKSKEIVEENEIENPEKYTKNGTYRYGSSPNTFIRVNVVNVPVRGSGGSRSGGSRSGGSSHHSSCACACVSSCACACACASSGRAGCTVKDFFKEQVHKGRIRVESKRHS